MHDIIFTIVAVLGWVLFGITFHIQQSQKRRFISYIDQMKVMAASALQELEDMRKDYKGEE